VTETTKRRVERLERRHQDGPRVDLSSLSAEQRARLRPVLEDLVAGRLTFAEALAQVPLTIGADGAVGIDESQTLTRRDTPEPSLDDDRRHLRVGSDPLWHCATTKNGSGTGSA
jgi:hypothetical protein